MNENEFEYYGVKLKAVDERCGCDECHFDGDFDCELAKRRKLMPFCTELCRDDMRHVIFVEVQDERAKG